MSTMTTSFLARSPASLPRRRSPLLTSPPRPLLRASQLTNGVCEQRFALLKINCDLGGIKRAAKSEPETTSSWLSSAVVDENDVVDSGFASLKSFGIDKIRKMLGSQLCVASLVMVILSASFTVVGPVSSSLAMMELPYVEKEVVKESSPVAISLARHLHSIGAKLYGAFWCSHCVHQKEIFGREAVKLLDSIECYPDGVMEGTQMAQACSDVNLKYLPSWEINGEMATAFGRIKIVGTTCYIIWDQTRRFESIELASRIMSPNSTLHLRCNLSVLKKQGDSIVEALVRLSCRNMPRGS